MKKTGITLIDNKTFKEKIYEIRGQKVMLDSELAEIYGYETRYLNLQVKRNQEKFPADFIFQLTQDEANQILMLQNVTSSWGGTRKLPYAFTEQGIYMLMTVLKGELATKQSIAIIRLFKKMKDYIVDTENLITANELLRLSRQTNKNTNAIVVIENKLDIMMDNFINPSTYKHFLILNGDKLESDVAYQDIYKQAKESIVIVDDYINIKTLALLKSSVSNIKVTIVTDNKTKDGISQEIIDTFVNESKNTVTIRPNNSVFHDRYIVIDNKEWYHCGSSSKDGGKKITTIMKIEHADQYLKLFKGLGII